MLLALLEQILEAKVNTLILVHQKIEVLISFSVSERSIAAVVESGLFVDSVIRKSRNSMLVALVSGTDRAIDSLSLRTKSVPLMERFLG